MVLFLFVIMLVNVGAEEQGRSEILNKPRQVAASLVFCLLLVAGLLFAINTGYQGLQKRDEAKLSGSAEQRRAQDQNLASGRNRNEQDYRLTRSRLVTVFIDLRRCRLKLPAYFYWSQLSAP